MKHQPIDYVSAIQKIKDVLSKDGLYSKNLDMDAALKLAIIDNVLKGVDVYVKQRQQEAKQSQTR